MELSSLESRRRLAGRLQAGGSDGESSSWGFGSSRRGGMGQSERLLGGVSSSSTLSMFSEPTDASQAPGIDPCVVCCTLFSACGAFLLILLGVYAAADSDGKYLILRSRENPYEEELRGTKAGHIFGAAFLYLLFVAGCGFKWYNRQPCGCHKRQ